MRFRSVLFAPASRPDLVAKMPRCRPTTIVLDLEDAVADSAKAMARSRLADLVAMLRAAGGGFDVFVRVNPVDTPSFQDDLGALVPGLSGVMLPKVADRSQVERVAAVTTSLGRPLPVFVGLETVAGVLNARAILAADGVCAVYFGAEDYIADLGGVRTGSSTEVLYARSHVAMAARVNGVAAVDQIVASFTDRELFVADAMMGRTLGYQGKLCIHPSQVEATNQTYAPTGAELEWASKILELFDSAVASGVGSVAFEGQMIDEPLARQARSIISGAR